MLENKDFVGDDSTRGDDYLDEFNKLNTVLQLNNIKISKNTTLDANSHTENVCEFRKFDFYFPVGWDDASSRVHSTASNIRSNIQTHCIQAMPLNRHGHTCQNHLEQRKKKPQ